MGLDYSYTQPSDSENYGYDTSDSVMEDLIRQDQAEISSNRANQVLYPPQPEVEFGFPQVCYCGEVPLIRTSYSRNDPGRRYYTCGNVDDGECHVHKWWDVAVMEEMRAREKHILQLDQKVDMLTCMSDFETEQKVANLEKIVSELALKKSRFGSGFELGVVVMMIMVLVLGIVLVKF